MKGGTKYQKETFSYKIRLIQNSAAASHIMPQVTTHLAPKRQASAPAVGAAMRTAPAKGRKRRPVWKAFRPAASWKNIEMTRIVPNSPRETISTVIRPKAKLRYLNRLNSNNVSRPRCSCQFSTRTKAKSISRPKRNTKGIKDTVPGGTALPATPAGYMIGPSAKGRLAANHP